MNIPLLYVAGPYSANETYSEQDHIKRAEQASIQLIKQGFHVITPHKNTDGYEKYEDGNITFDTWIEMDLNILKRCDGIYLFGEYKKSRGSMIELNCALENNIPVFLGDMYSPDKLTFDEFESYRLMFTSK